MLVPLFILCYFCLLYSVTKKIITISIINFFINNRNKKLFRRSVRFSRLYFFQYRRLSYSVLRTRLYVIMLFIFTFITVIMLLVPSSLI